MPTFSSTSGSMPTIQGTGTCGGFVRQTNLIGQLVVVRPVKVVTSLYNEGKPDQREDKKLIADVVVLTGEHAGEHAGVWLSGGKIIELGQAIIDDQLDSVLAGRMTRKPLKKFAKVWATPAELEEAIADPLVVVPSNAYAWLIPNPGPEDLALIQQYYATGTIPAADDSDADPFDD